VAKLLLFASVREKVGMDTLDVNVEKPMELSLFLLSASRQASIRPSFLQNPYLLYCINGEMAGLNSTVCNMDEVAVMPPLSGGV